MDGSGEGGEQEGERRSSEVEGGIETRPGREGRWWTWDCMREREACTPAFFFICSMAEAGRAPSTLEADDAVVERSRRHSVATKGVFLRTLATARGIVRGIIRAPRALPPPIHAACIFFCEVDMRLWA